MDPSPEVLPELYYTYHHGYDPDNSLPWKRPPRFVAFDELSFNRESRCVQISMAYLPIIIDNYFVNENKITSRILSEVKNIAENIKNELSDYLRNKGYIKTANKVDKIEIMSGTPNNWPINRYDLKIIKNNSHIENILSIRSYHQKLMIKTMYPGKILSPDDLFDSSLYIVNAYYQQQLNTIMINAGILLMPIYSDLYDNVSKYARLGVFIGHELSHSIDYLGNFFDSTGSYNPWSLDIDEDHYINKIQCFIDTYTKYTMYDNLHNGEQTLNENIADIIGFRNSYNYIFYNSNNNHKYTNEDKRKFFTVYAQTWCSNTNKNKEKKFIENSVHSTPEMRVNNVVIQHPDFIELFNCNNNKNIKKCNIY
jgi:predicted metalloendopeptidase